MNGREILLVEDDVALMNVLYSELSGVNFKVHCARDGESANKILKENKNIKAVISDLCLPGMSGLEFMVSMKELLGAKSVPFILMTGFINEFDEKKAHHLGVTSFLVKPFHMDLLFSSIMMALQDFETKAA